MDRKKILSNVGLTEQESKVYLAALEVGDCLPKKLAERAGLKRPTLYNVLPNLVKKGLLVELVKGKRKYISAQDIKPYLEIKRSELEKIEGLVPELRSIMATASSKPKLIFYEGVEGIKKVYNDHLTERGEVLEIVGIEKIHPELQKYIEKYYVPERVRRKINLKMLVAGPTVADIFDVKTNSLELRTVKNIDDKLIKAPLGIDIYGENISIALHRKDSEMIGLIIRSKEISDTLRSIFNFVWGKVED